MDECIHVNSELGGLEGNEEVHGSHGGGTDGGVVRGEEGREDGDKLVEDFLPVGRGVGADVVAAVFEDFEEAAEGTFDGLCACVCVCVIDILGRVSDCVNNKILNLKKTWIEIITHL